MSDHFFKSLKIENFRGIESLEINDLARINLFVGQNNTGKTTVLESAFLLAGVSNPELLIDINAHRGLGVTHSSVFGDYFCDSSFEGLRLSATNAQQERRLAIKPLYKDQLSQVMRHLYNDQLPQAIKYDPDLEKGLVKDSPKNVNVISDAPRRLVGLKCEVEISEPNNKITNEFQTAVAFSEVGRRISKRPTVEKYTETISGIFNSRQTSYNSVSIDRMLNDKKKEILLSALRIIEESVKDIRVGTDESVYIDIGRPSFMPINLAGDGLVQILELITGIATNGVCIVDEIGSGLHISSIRDMWEAILKLSKEHGTQIFATTHSKDVVEALQEMMANGKIEEGEVATYLLDKTPKSGVKAYKQSTKQMVRAWECGSDSRI